MQRALGDVYSDEPSCIQTWPADDQVDRAHASALEASARVTPIIFTDDITRDRQRAWRVGCT